MGSGAKLKQDYARYKNAGKNIHEYFRKEILFDFGTFEEMNRKEIELIDDKVLADPKSYNRCRGGSFQFAYPKGCIIIEHDGRKGSLREWSEWIGLSPDIIRTRFRKGMSMAEIIALPPRERDKIWFNGKGEGHTLNEWCNMTGLNYARVSARLRAGWTLDEALSKEKFCGNKYLYRGKTYTTPELEKMTGIPAETLLARMNIRGWSVEKAVETPLMPNPTSIWEKKFEWNGGSYTIEELAGMSGGKVFKWTIHDRIKSGWDIDRIMTIPSEAVDTSWKKKRYDYHGKQLTVDEGAKIAGITPGGLK